MSKKEDCYYYFVENDMGAYVDCCAKSYTFGDCPCEECMRYLPKNDIKKIVKALEDIRDSMDKNQCYACNHEFIETQDGFMSNILTNCVEFLKKYPNIVQCKDCKYFRPGLLIECKKFHNTKQSFDWFCADGERRTNDA